MNSTIKWVNHASYILKYEGITLITDPWLEGRVFFNSWELLSKTQFGYNDFEEITHIWFSHEHPDHFFPPNLKKIPEKFRKKITVLFHESIDKKVISFCKKLDFKEIIELKDGYQINLSLNFSLLCRRVENDSDSWLYVKTPEFSILNLNDCIFSSDKHIEKIKKEVGNVDVLLTQFSYANWVGNFEDEKGIQKIAKNKIDEIDKRIQIFNPKYLIPFASFVWFCHEDNFYLNQFSNKTEDVERFFKQKYKALEVLIFYPGFEWEIFQDYNLNAKAISLYTEDRNSLVGRAKSMAETIPLNEIVNHSIKFTDQIKARNNKMKLFSIAPFKVYLKDHKMSFTYSYKNGLKEADIEKDLCDIELNSDMLAFIFSNSWGFDTLLVSSLFRKPEKGDFSKVKEYIYVSEMWNKGKGYDNIFLRAYRKILRSLF